MLCELYHDESQADGFWHGMLLVPAQTRMDLLALLERCRDFTTYRKPVGIKQTRKMDRKASCVEAWAHVGVSALVSRVDKLRNPIFLGQIEKGRRVYSTADTFIGAKFILFRERDGHESMENHVDHGSKIETTLRMGLKGGLHRLGDAENEIQVTKLHFDGWQHHKRHIDADRVVGRMENLRDYCSVSCEIDDRSSNHERSDSQPYDDCQLLQLTDVLIGTFRSACGACTNQYQERIAQIAKPLVDRYACGPARMKNSRWAGGFCMSQCQLENGAWAFSDIVVEKQTPTQGTLGI